MFEFPVFEIITALFSFVADATMLENWKKKKKTFHLTISILVFDSNMSTDYYLLLLFVVSGTHCVLHRGIFAHNKL